MIISWNVRGLNKVGKLREISSRLLKLHPTIAIILETRVKAVKANKVRDQLKLRGKYLDNYCAHPNGRIWLIWDDNSLDVRHVKSTSQMIHCGVYDVNGDFKFWMTAMYALNQLDQRKILWQELVATHSN
jgi:hypothetical protein